METQTTPPSSEVTNALPPQGVPIFRTGDTVEINGGRFFIKSIGHKAMILEKIAGRKPTLESDLPIQTRIENTERELAQLIKLRDA